MNKITHEYKFTPKKTLVHKICDFMPRVLVSGFVLLGGALGHLHWDEPTFSVISYVISMCVLFSGLEKSK